MADRELVIKVPEELLEYFANHNCMSDDGWFSHSSKLLDAFRNATPLPEGHGDIVDIETLIDLFWDGNSMEISKYDLSVIEPLIPADRS